MSNLLLFYYLCTVESLEWCSFTGMRSRGMVHFLSIRSRGMVKKDIKKVRYAKKNIQRNASVEGEKKWQGSTSY